MQWYVAENGLMSQQSITAQILHNQYGNDNNYVTWEILQIGLIIVLFSDDHLPLLVLIWKEKKQNVEYIVFNVQSNLILLQPTM